MVKPIANLDSERILILGASGGVGSTASRFLTGNCAEILEMASYERNESSAWGLRKFFATDFNLVKEFAPTLVIDAAFITRERIREVGEKSFIETNLRLIEFAKDVQKLPSVRSFIGISSGASMIRPDDYEHLSVSDMYGEMKRDYEVALVDSQLGEKTTIARIWSVTCPFVTKLSVFAFSDLIGQGRQGVIRINSTGEVWRRYVDLAEFINVVMAANPGESRIIDSGGELIEIGDLARVVFQVLDKPERIERTFIPETARNDFYSDNRSWENAINQLGFTPKNIIQQLADVALELPA
jgi:nucleoside-diphosphate-sugar epimerase